ncbi:GNAT family N-acetyltransferase [Diaphorobacter ruginosibacter]|uniref:GNAT family N-acetyltransferase n=1 Tax=Diaphorobacter ruginosibacter TaxID=1715720 RepID=A0A7G9RJH3_9BURK|nr:GNAT family N-acetyltransferase [Diaphorobacter ruginosibacter]
MVTIRPATAADVGALQTIYARSISEAVWLPERAKISPVFADASIGELVHVAVSASDVVVGLVSVYVADSFIHHLYVHPDARRSSVGQALLASLGAWLPRPWRLKCVLQNSEALRFYRRGGWSEVDFGESEHGPFVVLSFP